MRLIDADALLKALNEKGVEYRAHINAEIMNAPTIDTDPVRHGKWENGTDNTEYKECSLCGWVHDVLTYGNNYCPNCGARMDKE